MRRHMAWLLLVVSGTVAGIWGFDIIGWISAGVGQQVVESVIRIAILAVITFAAMELAGLLITEGLGREYHGGTRLGWCSGE